jgi:glycosyltransferase involved in cell wall biosynthesis
MVKLDENWMKIGFFIIAYNAEAHIEQTLARIPADVWDEITQVYIVDDCSTDDTVKRAVSLCKQYPKLRVIRNRINHRYGGNQKIGYQYAIDQKLDVVVMLHADGQYAPEIIRTIYAPIVDSQADVVLGSRMIHRQDALQGGMPKYKYLGNIILTSIQGTLSGLKLSEFHTGYRAYRTSFLRSIPFWENSDEWHFDTEILLQAHAAKAKLVEVPIPTYYGNEICHVNGIKYALNCIVTSGGFFFARKDIFYSRKYDVSLRGRIYFSKMEDPYSSHSMIVNQLKKIGMQNQRILELGVGDATLTEIMNKGGAEVTCIELDPRLASLALPFAHDVKTANVEQLSYWPEAGKSPYDIIVAADILEHLVDPESVLSKLKAGLKKDGILIVSLPNVANLYVRLNLLVGRFPYHTKGILDRTHLHFYTLKSMRHMLAKTGWVVEKALVTSIPVAIVFPFLCTPWFRWVLVLLHGLTTFFRSLLGYQSVLICRNPNDATLL